nr:MAG TPA: hypothetical protein [Caudoviricetes sp.]
MKNAYFQCVSTRKRERKSKPRKPMTNLSEQTVCIHKRIKQ